MEKSPINWVLHFEQQKKSKLSIREYCQGKGLRLSLWYKQKRTIEKSQFMPVVVNKKTDAEHIFDLKISLSGNKELQVKGPLESLSLLNKLFVGIS